MCKNILVFTVLLLTCLTTVGCVKTVTETKVEYIKPEIPASVISKCDPVPTGNFTTNGELLMAYISLQSSYVICASKVTSIANILQSYDVIYTNDNTSEDNK